MRYDKNINSNTTFIDKVVLSAFTVTPVEKEYQRPKMQPTEEQIAAAQRRAFVLEFQRAYISKGLTQDSS